MTAVYISARVLMFQAMSWQLLLKIGRKYVLVKH